MVGRSGYDIFDINGKPVKSARMKDKASTATADTQGGGGLTDMHCRNFRDQITGVTNVANSPVNEGHASTMLCHLGNIAYRTGEDVIVNPKTGKAKNKAAKKLWKREFEPGWEMKI